MKPVDMDVVILCGGKGSRLQEVVNDRPKPMAQINETPFLEILIKCFSGFGFRRFILCTGYMSEAIDQYYKDQGGDLQIVISNEDEPLGTGGAVKNAEKKIRSKHFIVANGDSFCQVDLSEMLDLHFQRQALMTMAVIESTETKEAGLVHLDDSHMIKAFQEKTEGIEKGYVNTGIYILERDVLSRIKANEKSSLEYDLFPELTNADCYGYVAKEELFDIGTPQRLEKARKFFNNKCC